MSDTARKIIALSLAVLMSLSAAACAGDTDDTASLTDTDTAAVSEEHTDPLAERKAISDDLPDTDMDGYNFRVFAQDGTYAAFYAEEDSGDIVEQALYQAALTTKERFNVAMTVEKSGLGDEDHAAKVRTILMSGEDAYNMVSCHDVISCNYSLDGLLTDLYTLPRLNFEKPWWHDVKELTILGHAFLITSDISLLSLQHTMVIYVNRDIAADNQIEVPYQAVFDGAWTLDMLIGLTKDVYSDVNGNMTADEEDIYGYLTEPNCYGYLESFGMDTLFCDSDGYVSCDFDTDKMSQIVSKVYAWLYQSTGAKATSGNNVWSNTYFEKGKAMFAHGHVFNASSTFRYVENLNYGILPIPKWDESQENYIGTIMDYPLSVPSALPLDQYEYTGTIIEAMSAEGYKQTFPAYYEIALKIKYAQDDESVRTLEIINSTRKLSMSWCYENFVGFNQVLYSVCFLKNDANYMSYHAANIKKLDARVKTINKKFDKLGA